MGSGARETRLPSAREVTGKEARHFDMSVTVEVGGEVGGEVEVDEIVERE